jgi:HEAT repeat protein
LVARTAEDLLLTYTARLKLWEGDAQEIIGALRSADTEARVEALHILGARKMREQIPEVLRLLSDEDEGVRDAALGALVVLHERSAIKALAESHQMRDTREMRKILDAIATLGGSEARDYLSFVAETHDDEEIRAMAKEALDRLSRHDEPKQPTK